MPSDDLDTPIPAVRTYDGAVLLKDWLLTPDTGKSVKIVAGHVTVMHQDELVGFRVKGGESNWVALVSGETERVTLLGCQIRGFLEGTYSFGAVDSWVVE